MEYVGLLAPIAFVFAISALVQIGSLKKEVDRLREKMQAMEKQQEEAAGSNQDQLQ